MFAKCCCLAVPGGVCHLHTIETAARQNLVTSGSKSDQATVFFKERKRFISCLFLLSTDRFFIYLDISYLWIWSRVFGPTLTLNVSIFLSLCQMCCASRGTILCDSFTVFVQHRCHNCCSESKWVLSNILFFLYP